MKKLLLIDCFEEENKNKEFNSLISEIYKENKEIQLLFEKAWNLDYFENFEEITHIIISGSYASAYEEKIWNKPLINFLKKSEKAKKSILGICYGHQFLAKTFAGNEFVKKSKTPEFGFAEIKLKKHKLFHGLKKIIAAVFHYDEVSSLPNDFKILASSKKCKIHAFQYKEKQIFGLQFHPEYNEKVKETHMQEHLKNKPEDKPHFIDERPKNYNSLELNKIFHNFINL